MSGADRTLISVAERIRFEAGISARPGQHDRLMRLADEVADMEVRVAWLEVLIDDVERNDYGE